MLWTTGSEGMRLWIRPVVVDATAGGVTVLGSGRRPMVRGSAPSADVSRPGMQRGRC